MSEQPAPRNGGDLVTESLVALGATTVFGIPGQHALGLFDALRRSSLRFVSSRVENNAAFAADGYARVAGRPAALFLSTGPGALTALAGLQEAYASSVPVIVIASQLPVGGLGGVRRGMLHQLDDQAAAAAQVTKTQHSIRHQSAIAATIETAWAEAISHPQGPVWVEVPQDLLLAPTAQPPVRQAQAQPRPALPRAELVEEAARLLADAERPAIIAGGGVRRSGAETALRSLAERIDAPVVASPGGVGALELSHPLSLGSWVEDRAVTELLAGADVLLALGTSLGEVTSHYFSLLPSGRLIQVDAEPRVLESNHPALGIAADAGATLAALLESLPQQQSRSGAQRAEAVRAVILERLDGQQLGHERAFLRAIRAGIPEDAQTFWDMTIAAYWGWNSWDSATGGFHSAQGAGGLGFGLPGAIGAAVAQTEPGARSRGRVLAVAGDGSAMYGIAELATLVQHRLPVTWLIVDDGGYGILRDYMIDAFGQATHTELSRPDFCALAESFGVRAHQLAVGGEAGYDQLTEALARSFAAGDRAGPEVIVVPTLLRMFAAS